MTALFRISQELYLECCIAVNQLIRHYGIYGEFRLILRCMADLRAVSRVTLSEQVAVQLAEMISNGQWICGERLPAESSLCETLGVGRSTLREALKSLAFIGLVCMRAGDGTYVAPGTPGLLNRILARGLLKTEKDLADVCETRLLLESELAALAAERRTAAQLEQLKAVVAESFQSLHGSNKPFTQMDVEFHFLIATCSGNKVLPRLLIDIRSLLVEWIAKSQELPGLRENAQTQHERILECIANRDPDAARNEMQLHLQTFQRAYTLLGRISDSQGGVQAGSHNVKLR